jgi:hypothetical protein
LKTVNINKIQLINILKENLKKHAEDLDKVLINYRQEMIIKFQDHLTMFKTANTPKDIMELELNMWPQKPISHIDDYNKALRMAELSVDDVIELDEREFSKFVMDEWAWKQEFEMTKTLYGV